MKGTAIVLTQGLLDSKAAKTAHGLIRGSERFEVKGIIDYHLAGKDAGEVLDGSHRGIPVVASIEKFLEEYPRPDFCILGVANAGGLIAPEWMEDIKAAIRAGISIVSGMHQFLSETPEIAALAKEYKVKLMDVRMPRPRSELHFWTGDIHHVNCSKIAVMGTDCAIGKRTTAKFMVEAVRAAGLKSEMIYTGQTGWMQGWNYGFVFDTTINDFVSGELEHAIVTCDREAKPDVVFIEGQAALRNPSGPCGSEFLVSGMADAVILVHAPGRTYYKGWEHTGRKIPPISNEIELVRMYGVETIGIALNTLELSFEEAIAWQEKLEQELGIPVVLPIEQGVERLLPAVRKLVQSKQNHS